jgi:hypothetical protein
LIVAFERNVVVAMMAPFWLVAPYGDGNG